MEGSQETMAAEMETVGVKCLSNMGADADFGINLQYQAVLLLTYKGL